MDEYINDLHFTYDSAGPATVIFNNNTYFYLRNAQGDIYGLTDKNGNWIIGYSYDAWGNLLSQSTADPTWDTLANLNPLLYRGYVYDTETGLYYVSSRYYDSEICRFINADGYASTGQGLLGSNMFAYCENNPIRYKDPNGDIIIEAIIVIGVVALVSGLFSGIAAKATGGSFWEGFIEGTLIGGVSAAFCFFMPGSGVIFASAAAYCIDLSMQYYSYGKNNGGNLSEFKPNQDRAIKAAGITALLAMIPSVGAAQFCLADAAATTLIWSFASAGFTALDTVITVMWNGLVPNNNNQNTYRSTGYKKPGRSDWNCFSNYIM